MWRCPRCQTINSGKFCTFCGGDAPAVSEDTTVNIDISDVNEPTRKIDAEALKNSDMSGDIITPSRIRKTGSEIRRSRSRSSGGKWILPVIVSAVFVALIAVLAVFVIAPIFRGETPVKSDVPGMTGGSSNVPSKVSEEISAIDAKLKAMEIQYTGSSSYINEDKLPELLGKAEEYAASLMAKGSISYWESGDGCIYIKTADGTGYVYIPPVYGFDGSIAAVNTPGSQNFDTDHTALLLSDALSGLAFDRTGNYEGPEASVDALKEIDSHEVIIWHGHGGYTPSVGSFLFTGTSLSTAGKYDDDLYAGRLIVTSQGYYAVTPEFFRHYLTSMPGSLVFLGACSSGKDSSLADAFLEKGASVVIGMNGRVRTEYDTILIEKFFEGLSVPAPTGDVRTAITALEYACGIVGSADTGGVSAVIYGNGEKALHNGEGIELPDSMTLSTEEIELISDETFELKVDFGPREKYAPNVEWESSDTEVAEIENGIVKALKVGEAVITGRTSYGLEVSCRVTVVLDHIKPEVFEIRLEKSVMTAGSEQKASLYISPENAYISELLWESSNANIASVDSEGIIRAINPGTVVITAVSGEISAQYALKVIAAGPESIILNAVTLTLEKGDNAILSTTITPAEYAFSAVKWSVSDTSVITVDGGLVTAHNIGSAVVTATLSNGIKAECTVTVTEKAFSPDDYEIGISRGQLMPDFIMRTDGSRAVFLSGFEGKNTLLVIAGMEADQDGLIETLNAVEAYYRGSVNIVLAVPDSSDLSVYDIKNRFDPDFDILIITSSQLNQYSITDLPAAFVLDKNRLITDKKVGKLSEIWFTSALN